MIFFDVCVIGGGPGGYLAAERAAQAGKSACVVEKRALGGVCLNEGCIPTKTLLNSAKMYDYATGGARYGLSVEGASLDHSKVIDRKNMVVKQLVAGVAAKLKQHEVRVFSAEGRIVGKNAEGLIEIEAGDERVTCRDLIIATGSEAAVPPIPGAREGIERGFVVTNREILDIRTVPGSLCVIGGGVIGLEMASYFRTLGAQVTVLEMLPAIAGATDAEIAGILQKNYQKKGVAFKLGCKVTSIGDNCVIYEENGESKSAQCELVLMAVGRRPNTRDIGLEALGIETERGAVVVDERQRTSCGHVYAVGDVTAKLMLAHVAYRQAEVAVNVICGADDVMDYSAVPAVIYTSPEVACCGETLASAQSKGIDAREVSVSMRYSGRYLAEVAGGDGLVKLVFDGRRLIGAHMIGSYVSESIWGVAVMIGQKMSVEQMKKVIFPHPTVCEVIREGLFE